MTNKKEEKEKVPVGERWNILKHHFPYVPTLNYSVKGEWHSNLGMIGRWVYMIQYDICSGNLLRETNNSHYLLQQLFIVPK